MAATTSRRLPLTAGLLLLIAAGCASGGHDHDHDPDDHGHTHAAMDYTVDAGVTDDAVPRPAAGGSYWWRGNLHTHTLWSDGDAFPEVVAEWYRRNGYHFLALSDHNVLLRAEKWVAIDEASEAVSGRTRPALDAYRQRFGGSWVQTRQNAEGATEVRLKPLAEFRTLFEAPGRFLMIESEEITDRRSVHVNATNITEFIPPQGGETVTETIENNIRAVLDQEQRTGQPMFPHLNHPNFSTAVTVEEMVGIRDLQFFEVYNGHRGVRNLGDAAAYIPPLERMWDIMLAVRLGEMGLGPLYGLAVDDAHHYEHSTSQTARPGRGWIMVQAAHLSPEHLVRAIRGGDFYATTGVVLSSIERESTRLNIVVEPEEGIEYKIEFIGTRRGFDASSRPVLDEEGQEVRATRYYSDQIGQVLKTVTGTHASYELTGDELYVRARITSSKSKVNGFTEGELETAWIQPLVPSAGP